MCTPGSGLFVSYRCKSHLQALLYDMKDCLKFSYKCQVALGYIPDLQKIVKAGTSQYEVLYELGAQKESTDILKVQTAYEEGCKCNRSIEIEKIHFHSLSSPKRCFHEILDMERSKCHIERSSACLHLPRMEA